MEKVLFFPRPFVAACYAFDMHIRYACLCDYGIC